MSRLVALLLVLPTANAHLKHFEGHPEWDNLWPDPFAINDLGHRDAVNGALLAGTTDSDTDDKRRFSAAFDDADAPPDLSGVWTGSSLGSPDAR